MKIQIEPKAFREEVYKLLGVTSGKGPLAVVNNTLLTANKDNTLRLEATDLEVSISTSLECTVEKPGSLCLNAHNLHNILKGLTADKVTIVGGENHWASLSAGDVDCKIVGIPPVEFPKLPDYDHVESVRLDARDVLDMIERTMFSVSTDQARANLTGAYMVVRNGRVLQIATDGHRLSKAIREVATSDVPKALEDGIIIPRKSMSEIRRALDPSMEDVHIGVNGNNAIVQFGATTIMVRLIDATFPDYNRVIPDELPERQARINREEFTQKLKFITLFASRKSNSVAVALDDNSMTLSANDPEMGDAREVMPVVYSGPAVEIGFNQRYLNDVAGVLREDEFRFQLIDAYSPSLIFDGDTDDDLFLIMPMRV